MPIKNEPFRTIQKKKNDFMQVILLANIMVPLFIKTKILLIVSDICFLFLYMVELQGKLVHCLCSRLAINPWSSELTIKTLERCSGVFIVDFV